MTNPPEAVLPVIPSTITVHLGAPSDNAPNVTLPFLDYILNVASSEIYPTWPESAIRANIYAQISFALNRIYSEYYRSRGYDFDITNDTQFDQYFVNGRDIFENIQQIGTEIFTDYIRRQGAAEPLFAQYCDGQRTTCDGLSQWGSVTLANDGFTPYQILTNYYGDDIDIVTDTPIQGVTGSAPSAPLRLGFFGNDVRTVQIRLNRISNNYPSIPKIYPPDGVFTFDTEAAVRSFQRIFNLTEDGIVGPATWYAILRIYNAVKRLNSLNSEGIALEDVTKQFEEVLQVGSRGINTANLQYFLQYLSAYYSTIPPVEIDGIYGNATRDAVIATQNTFGLTQDGIVGEQTWNAIYNAYLGIVRQIPVAFTDGNIIPFQGTVLRQGADSDEVRVLQEYLNFISGFINEIPPVNPTGYFGDLTRASVEAFQELYGFPVTGQVNALTWATIADLYSDLYVGSQAVEGQYPGYVIGE